MITDTRANFNYFGSFQFVRGKNSSIIAKNGDLNERIKRKSNEFWETVVKAQPDQKVKIDPYMGQKVE